MLLLIVGGVAGTLARYYIGQWFARHHLTERFPWGTFAINVSGSFLLAFFVVLILERLPAEHHHWYLLLGVGFCGAYTTFSTFELETFQLIQKGHWGYALAYVLGSVFSGFVGVLLGMGLGHWVFPKQPL